MEAVERVAAAALAVIVSASSALAGGPFERRRAAAMDGVVEIELPTGSLQVLGWERAEVEVTGVLGRGNEELILEGSGHLTVVRVVVPHHCRRCEGSELTVRVPSRSRLQVTTINADATLSRLTGVIAVTSVSGEVAVASGPARVEARSSSGCVRVDGVTAPVLAASVSGDVVLRDVVGRVQASSVSGEVVVRGGEISRGELGTTSGRVRFAGGLVEGAYLKVASVSGNVELLLPPAVNATFDVSTFSGEIVNEIGPRPTRSGRYTAEQQVLFVIGSGRSRVEATSFSGTVHLRGR